MEYIINDENTVARYWTNVLDEDELESIYSRIDVYDPPNEEVVVFGKRHIPKRKTMAFGDKGTSYKYSGQIKTLRRWSKSMTRLRNIVNEITEAQYNFALFQVYPDGEASIGWHSDDEKDLIDNSIITSISFGATRTFRLKHKETNEIIDIDLEHNSLLTMEGRCQKEYKHCVPVRKS